MRRTTTDARTIVRMECVDGSGRVKFAANSPHVAEKIKEGSRAEDTRQAIFEGLIEQVRGNVRVDCVHRGGNYDETSRTKLDGIEVEKRGARRSKASGT